MTTDEEEDEEDYVEQDGDGADGNDGHASDDSDDIMLRRILNGEDPGGGGGSDGDEGSDGNADEDADGGCLYDTAAQASTPAAGAEQDVYMDMIGGSSTPAGGGEAELASMLARKSAAPHPSRQEQAGPAHAKPPRAVKGGQGRNSRKAPPRGAPAAPASGGEVKRKGRRRKRSKEGKCRHRNDQGKQCRRDQTSPEHRYCVRHTCEKDGCAEHKKSDLHFCLDCTPVYVNL